MKLLSKRTLFPFHTPKDLYYQSLIVKSNLESSYKAVREVHAEVTETYKDITYRDLRWGSSAREVISKLDNLRYKVESLNDLRRHLVLFFKREILNQKTIVQCHFLDNQLYFIHIDFISALSNEISFINDLVYNKYILESSVSRSIRCIKDCNQNKLIINNDVTLSIDYVSGMPSIVLSLEKQLQSIHKSKYQKPDYSMIEL